MHSIPGPSIHNLTGPVARFDVPISRMGSKASPSIGHCNPVDRPETFCIGNNDTTSPSATGKAT